MSRSIPIGFLANRCFSYFRYPGIPLWISEFALDYSPVLTTEANFNQTIALFDNDTSIERYSYFGSFRSSDSGVGWNATMLDTMGDLTNIGSWYLGGGTVRDASTTTTTSSPAATSSTKSSSAPVRRAGGMEMIGSAMIGSAIALGLLLS